jgi:hypothetical protein
MNKHRKDIDKIFFGLLINPRVPSLGWKTTWRQLKLSLYNLKRFFYEIWWFRGSDRGYTFDILKIALEEHLRVISTPSELHEIDDTRIPKENAIKRCIEILNNVEEDNYSERCGYNYNYDLHHVPLGGKDGYSEIKSTETHNQQENNHHALLEGYQLAEEEFQELMNLLGDPLIGIRTWWK